MLSFELWLEQATGYIRGTISTTALERGNVVVVVVIIVVVVIGGGVAGRRGADCDS